jgi:DNA-binding CsgD family transcriptional regulator
MGTQANDIVRALSDKEKETLRLMVRGHDAKSIARSLGLSVHTINERLRDARRKMAVSSSREAARMLLAAESGEAALRTPEMLGDSEIGADSLPASADPAGAPIGGVEAADRRFRTLLGVLLMTLVLGLLAIATLPHLAPAPYAAPQATVPAADAAVVNAACEWLALVDQSRWDESYQATGSAFRKLNTPAAWAAASVKVRVPLGKALSRTLLSQENLPAPPDGYEVVKFRTRFANKGEAVETVTLEREDGAWRVVGVTIV